MKKTLKVLLAIVVIMMILSSITVIISAQDTAFTHISIYIGEFEGRDAHIVFGSVSNKNVPYGVVITDVENGSSFAFEGKAIGLDGKFGIAIYAMENGREFTAKVYSGDPKTGVFGEEIPFVSGKSEYIVNFYGADGELLKSDTVAHGASAVAPTDPFKVSSYFDGWDKDFETVYTDLDIRPLFVTSEVEGLKLYKEKDKDFKILNLADIQIINTETELGAQQGSIYPQYIDRDTAVYDTIRKLVSDNDPDYIVLNGDNIYSRFDFSDLRTHRELMTLIDGFGIPWSVVIGNHDGDTIDCDLPETDVMLEDVLNIYNESEYFVFDQSGSELGDYKVSLIEKESGEIVNRFFFMYTHTGYLNDAQIDWYENEAKKLSTKNGVIPSVLWMHVPLPELQDALIEKYGNNTVYEGNEFVKLSIPNNDIGDFGEYNSAGYSAQYGLFDVMKLYGSTQLAIFGHEHSNNASVEYKGIRLTYALKTGLYDQREHNHLNGATLLTIDADNLGYGLTNDFVDQAVCDYGGRYDFDVSPKTIPDGITKLKLSNGQAAAVSGSKKILLSEGEKAYIEFDMVTPLSLTGKHTESNFQFGFRVSSIPISSTWVGSSKLIHFSKAGSHSTSTIVEDVVPISWAIDETNTNEIYNNAIEEIFKADHTYRFEIDSSGNFNILFKKSAEDIDKFIKFAYGSVDKSLISNGFYLGLHTNREFRLKNMKITGSAYLVDYTFALCSFEISMEKKTFNYDDNSEDVYPGFISNDVGVKIPQNGSISYEMTIVSAPSNITASSMAAFVVTDNAKTLWMYATENAFRVHLHHGNIGGGIGGGKEWSGDKVENSYFDVSQTWTGSYVLVPYKRYKFEMFYSGKYTLSVKYGLDDSPYEVIYTGTANLDMSKEYYVGFLSHSTFEFADLAINGEKITDYSEIYLKNGTLS
ncbi:MAG: metallophosphoesterase [Clostridia bacterium]|nr:metallophosphoesterase [Clostridia bacterium]